MRSSFGLCPTSFPGRRTRQPAGGVAAPRPQLAMATIGLASFLSAVEPWKPAAPKL
jgi:hypothetical protein